MHSVIEDKTQRRQDKISSSEKWPEAEFFYVTGTKVLRVFLLAIHTLLYYRIFFHPPFLSKIGLKLVCNVNNEYGNLKSENSQDYAQKRQHNCMFINLPSGKGRSRIRPSGVEFLFICVFSFLIAHLFIFLCVCSSLCCSSVLFLCVCSSVFCSSVFAPLRLFLSVLSFSFVPLCFILFFLYLYVLFFCDCSSFLAPFTPVPSTLIPPRPFSRKSQNTKSHATAHLKAMEARKTFLM